MDAGTDDLVSNTEACSWVGLDLGEHHVERLLGEGAFSWVYEGLHKTNSSKAVFKVAKPEEQVGTFSPDLTRFFPTQSLVQITGAFLKNVKLDAAELLSLQAQKLQSCPHKNLLRVDLVVYNRLITFYQCEYVDGENLRNLMRGGRANLSHLVALAKALNSILDETQFVSHGDLKPDNIILSGSGIKLIDPGYFGPLGTADQIAITTPAYYPFLDSDDLLAFGLLSWELLVGEHPLAGASVNSEDVDLGRVDPRLLEKIKRYELVGNYFGSGLLSMRRPSQINVAISDDCDDLLLKLLRLRIDNEEMLREEEGFANFAEIAHALESLK